MVEYKQETISNSKVAVRLTELDADGWELVHVLRDIPPPYSANGHPCGPGAQLVLLKRDKRHD